MIKKSKIAIITYDYPHRKTQDLVFGLKAKGYQNITLLALPYILRDNPFKPIYQHRPSTCYPIYPKDLAINFGYNCINVDKEKISNVLNQIQPTATLIAGAGILPKDLVLNHQIINSHPAYLPNVRGLDALKWAIYYKEKIGVTSHIVNENADAGLMLDRAEIPVYENDTFHAVAFRQYEKEIEMLIDAVSLIQTKKERLALDEKGKVHKRMPNNIEKNLLSYFEDYKVFFNSN